MSIAHNVWEQESSGLGTQWVHRHEDTVVAIRVRQSSHPNRDEKLFQLIVRPAPGDDVIWPADHPHSGGVGRYNCWSQAKSAAEKIREHIDLGQPIDEISVNGVRD